MIIRERAAPTRVVYDSPTSVTVTDRAFGNGLWAGRLEAVTIAAGAAYLWDYMGNDEEMGVEEEEEELEREEAMGGPRVDYLREIRETRDLIGELRAELAEMDELAREIERPLDGEYVGETAEDDDGDQSASTTLTFETDGTVTGVGFDEVDGAYTLEGRWSANKGVGRVAWVETYDEGFEVALRGQIMPDGAIRALWASDRGVGGSVALNPPNAADKKRGLWERGW